MDSGSLTYQRPPPGSNSVVFLYISCEIRRGREHRFSFLALVTIVHTMPHVK